MNFAFLKRFTDKISNFNIFELGNSVAAYYLLIFCLAALVMAFLNIIPIKFAFVNRGEVPWRALGYAVLGFLTFVFGYFGFLGKYFAGKTPNIFIGEWNPIRTKIVFWAFFIMGTLGKFFRIMEGSYFSLKNIINPFGQSIYYSLAGYLDWFWYIALIIAFISYYKLKKENGDYKKWKLLAFSVLAVEIFYGVPSCSRIIVIVPVIFYLLIKSHLFKIKLWQTICTAVLIIIILFPFGNICRNPAVLNYYRAFKSPAMDGARGEVVFYGFSVPKTGGFVIESFLGRVNQLFIFSKILDASPEINSLYGSSFSNFLFTLGPPKFLWPNKPLSTNNLGNELGHRLGILSPDDFKTSVGPTIIGDLYIIFGIWGIILGMFFMGVFFRFIYDYFMKLTNVSSSGLMIYSVFWVQIIQGMEGWIAPVWAGLIKIFVLLVITHLFLINKKLLIIK